MNPKPNAFGHRAPERSGDSKLLQREKRESPWLVFAIAASSLMALWFSFPPIGLWWLAWVALIPLVWLVKCQDLPGAKPYLQLWLAGLLYWLATFYFIPIPHPALWLGWVVVCLYMSIYIPLFVSVSRTLVHRFKIPTVLVVPVAWAGIEWFRCNFATGMAMACLSHTQYKQPVLIQVADLCGAYTLTFAICAVAAGLGIATLPRFLRGAEPVLLRTRIAAALVSIVALGLVLGYGQFRLSQPVWIMSPMIQVGIVQSSIDVVFESASTDQEREAAIERETARFEQYRDLTLAARQKWPDLGLILWPESAFPMPELLSDLDHERNVDYFSSAIKDVWHAVTGFPQNHATPVPLLTGSTTHDPEKQEMFNSALLIDEPGVVANRYFKNHRVMFGEYVPFADWFPILQATPIGSGLTAGTEFKCMNVGGVCFTPSICFETTIPHLIRRQINELADQQQEPDVIVNLTNDGWFFGTSCLDLHLACNIFRAVEMRKPNLVSANTGFSAEIDSNGCLLQVGPRREIGLLKAQVGCSQRTSPYRVIGDTIPATMGILCIIVFVANRFRRTPNG